MPSYPCSSPTTAMSIAVTLGTPSVSPSHYRVRWRPANIAGDFNTVITVNSVTPIIISGVPKCYNIEGTVEAFCGDGVYTAAQPFYIPTAFAECRTVKLLQTANYTYIACGADSPTTVTNNSLSPQTICVKDGSVTGGTFQDMNTACTG